MDDIKVSVVKYRDRKNFVLRYVDPQTGKVVARSAKTPIRRKAERAAAALQTDLREGRAAISQISWEDFRDQYEEGPLSRMKHNTFLTCGSVFNAIERICHPKKLSSLDSNAIELFHNTLWKEGKSDATIRTYLAHLKSSLNWAVSKKKLRECPKIDMPHRVKGAKVMKGRPITTEEFERMLGKVSEVVGEKVAPSWKYYLRGLWFSGLRLSESLTLRWDDAPNSIVVDMEGRRPMLRIPAEVEKGGQDRILSMAPEFAYFLEETPEKERRGHVFKLERHTRPDLAIRSDYVSDMVAMIGKAAKVVVNRSAKKVDGKQVEKIKYASAHDLRRSFGERWSTRIMPAVLQETMRHASIETTMKYYVGQNAERTADVLWEAFEAKDSQSNKTVSKEQNEDSDRAEEKPQTLLD